MVLVSIIQIEALKRYAYLLRTIVSYVVSRTVMIVFHVMHSYFAVMGGSTCERCVLRLRYVSNGMKKWDEKFK